MKNYFKQGKKTIDNVPIEIKQLLTKYVRKDEYDSYIVNIEGENLIILKNERKIEFFSFVKEELKYSKVITDEIENLETKLLSKISEYRKLSLFNKNQVVENATKLINLISIIVSPVSIVLCALTVLGIRIVNDIKNNIYAVITSGIILLIVAVFIFWLIYIPAIKLSKFNWNINYK